jgi:hypothetical protein
LPDGKEEREEHKALLERQKREKPDDRVDHNDPDDGAPERGGS